MHATLAILLAVAGSGQIEEQFVPEEIPTPPV